MQEYIDQITPLAINYGAQLLIAIVIFIIGKWIAKTVANAVGKMMTKRGTDVALVGFVHSLLYWVLLLFAMIAALGQLGIQTASFVAIVGAAGLAVGLALQGSLSNFAAGVLILIFKPFKVGDYIEAAGTAGTVEKISIFTTELNTPDNKKVIAPNTSVTSGNIVNVSANKQRRVDLVAGIGYRDDIDKARKVLNEILSSHPAVLDSPAPTVAVVALADSSVNLVVRPWVNGADYWTVYFEVTESIKKRFDEEGISIPFPQRDVHLYDQKSA